MKIIRLHVLLKDNTELKVRLFQQPKEEEAASEAETHVGQFSGCHLKFNKDMEMKSQNMTVKTEKQKTTPSCCRSAST